MSTLQQHIRTLIDTQSQKALGRIESTATLHAGRWTKHIQATLSRSTSKYGSRARPVRTALLPGKVTGKLRRQIYAKRLKTKKLSTGHYKVTIAFYGRHSKEAMFTNAGVNKPAKFVTGAWVGWADDVFEDVDRGKVLSRASVMDRVLAIYANTRSVRGVS